MNTKSASDEEVNAAAEAAAAASYPYGRSAPALRARFLRLIAHGIEAAGSTLIECAARETALAEARLVGELGRTCAQLRMFADIAEANHWIDECIEAGDPARTPQPKSRIRSRFVPLGPVVVFGASNFPLAFSVAGGDTASALAVGCPVIVKAHSAHPETSALVGSVVDLAAAECALPKGVFSLLFDAGYAVGVTLVRHPRIMAGAFTGSRSGGVALWRAAQARAQPIPFFAEMSSVNPIFVFPGAAAVKGLALAAGLHASITGSAGQLCTKPGLVFVVDDAATKVWLDALGPLLSQSAPSTMLTSAIRSACQRLLDERAGIEGVRSLAQAATDRSQVGATLLGVDVDTFVRTPALHDEIFGPTSLIVHCSSANDFLRCARALEGQLTATVWAEPLELKGQDEFLWTLEQRAGRLVFNGFPTGVEVGRATVHGGPFPATTDSRFTSVGTHAFARFIRPVAYQNELS
ncbi:MAG TPA: aldehyde dehydrogenase (NADP(+)) [Steroidobacteraceae bacterium]|jgi:NADP-dependent aldehyde dehydrogenase|nr:aldehyde dehydrogenase (NADP(+)) [Steroidobacteraceae bacterium]